MATGTLHTIGHSTQEVGAFIELLGEHAITVLVDVRSSPHSQYMSDYIREVLKATLKQRGIEYLFLGAELGARREERECYEGGVATYERIAAAPLFREGLDRLRKGVARHTVCLMCAEKDPLTCHRTILICRQLRGDFPITHILGPGLTESHQQSELRLLDLMGLPSRRVP